MTACAECGFENAAGRKFCGGCGAPLTLSCPSCGAANEPGTRFCGECGSALAEGVAPAAPAAPAATAERRVVSVLFADLVGFTPLSESRDPEEVRELLSRYFDRCRRLIEIYGGTVEKFIGDAVMAVWGTPVAQEDDAERAVRTALDLVAAVAALGEEVGADLQARAGVLTGEAAVTLSAEAEGMVAGDLVNTAARIQSAAAPGSVLVGETTRRASGAAIAYEDAGSFELKGKSDPLPLFRAVRLMSRRGGTVRSGELEPPFVGRHRELNLVKELFHATAEDRKAHLVSLVGIGGIGKSRLAWEFEKYIDGVAEIAYWHRGRCLAYGDGVAYWALAEMVRMRALISEEDSADEALTKLTAMLEEWLPDPDERAWVEPRLQQLLCLCDPTPDERQNLFSAWRLFFERLAARGPVVLVFEDLQWADASLLDFVDHLLDWSRAHPIFVLALARPEIAQRRPGFGSGGTALSLEPLSERAMCELLEGFVPGLPDDLSTQILERSEGVPLYAVETVRMLLDRGLLARDGEVYRPTGPIDALDVPETLHALVAARLDGLSPEERALLQNAAVLGKSFTKPGLAALSGLDDASLDELLTSLLRKEVLSVQADPRSPERGQYAFVQDILKRIAYDTLSRPERKARHLAAAAHLERTATAIEAELVEVIAHHYVDAYEAAPDADDARDIRRSAAEHLAQAGERAASLAASEEAQRYFERAAGLAEEPLWQADLVERAGLAAQAGGRYPEALALYERSIELYREEGEAKRIAHVTAQLGWTMWFAGDIAGGADRMEQAFAALADEEPGPELAELAEALGRLRIFLGDFDEARERIERALEIAEALVLPNVMVNALNTKHLLLKIGGRHAEGLALLRHAITLGREYDLGEPLDRALHNLSHQLNANDRFTEAMEFQRELLERSRRQGNPVQEQRTLVHHAYSSFMLGSWDALDEINPQLTLSDLHISNGRFTTGVRSALRRGDLASARAALEAQAQHRDSDEVQMRLGYLAIEAELLRAEGRPQEAMAAARMGVDMFLDSLHPFYKLAWSEACEAAFELGDLEQVEELLGLFDQLTPSGRSPLHIAQAARFRGRLLARHEKRAEAEEQLALAIIRFRELSTPYYLALALVDLAELGSEDPAPLLAEAREIFERLGATIQLERLDAAERAVTV